MGKAGTSISIRGTRGDDPNLIIPPSALITGVTVDGLSGYDTLNLSNHSSGVFVSLENGYAKSASTVSEKDFTGVFGSFSLTGSVTAKGTIKGVESLVGTSFNDFLVISTNGGGARIDGGAGNDVINSLGGNATLIGGTGSDWLVGYWQNVTLTGGTGAGPDGERDFFYTGSQNPLILDFEVGVDQLICEFADWGTTDWANGIWVSNGSGGATLMIGGVAEVTLANVSVAAAQTIDVGYAVTPVNGVVHGSSGDDMLYVGTVAPSRILLGDDNGDDITISFDAATDILVFEDGMIPVWSDTYVNGQQALVGTFAGGSITLPGLETGDVASLNIEGVAGAAAFGPDAMSAWSVNSDADYFP